MIMAIARSRRLCATSLLRVAKPRSAAASGSVRMIFIAPLIAPSKAATRRTQKEIRLQPPWAFRDAMESQNPRLLV